MWSLWQIGTAEHLECWDRFHKMCQMGIHILLVILELRNTTLEIHHIVTLIFFSFQLFSQTSREDSIAIHMVISFFDGVMLDVGESWLFWYFFDVIVPNRRIFIHGCLPRMFLAKWICCIFVVGSTCDGSCQKSMTISMNFRDILLILIVLIGFIKCQIFKYRHLIRFLVGTLIFSALNHVDSMLLVLIHRLFNFLQLGPQHLLEFISGWHESLFAG